MKLNGKSYTSESFDYFEFVRSQYFKKFEELKLVRKGRVTSNPELNSCLVSKTMLTPVGAPVVDTSAASTEDSSGKQSAVAPLVPNKMSMHYDIEKLKDLLETIRSKQANKMNIIRKLHQNPNENRSTSTQLVLTLDPEERVFYITTLGELHPNKTKSKFLQVLQFDKELPHRQGYRRLKRV